MKSKMSPEQAIRRFLLAGLEDSIENLSKECEKIEVDEDDLEYEYESLGEAWSDYLHSHKNLVSVTRSSEIMSTNEEKEHEAVRAEYDNVVRLYKKTSKKVLEQMKAELLAQLDRDLYLDPAEDGDDYEAIDEAEDYEFKPADLVDPHSEVAAKDDSKSCSEIAGKDDDKSCSEVADKNDDKYCSEFADEFEACEVVEDESPSFSSSTKFEDDIKGIKSKGDLENHSEESEIEAIDDATVVYANKDDGKEVPARVGTVSTMITSHIQLSPGSWQRRQRIVDWIVRV